ncbi:unnamed protein product [Blepharisma stoltei]|uniref:Exophilin 5 n=1 Tax=Blepharisma stoltei TaxID=1481888 RepID=A0AAU9I846_9CILI|nr:unnamed protein product [Blepharisma stoltei]
MDMQGDSKLYLADSSTSYLPVKTRSQFINIHSSSKLTNPNKEHPLRNQPIKIVKKPQNLDSHPRYHERGQQNFKIQDIYEDSERKRPRRPFKVLDYNPHESFHSRSPTTIIKEVDQSYQFVSALSSVPDSDQSRSIISIDFSDCRKGSFNLEYLDNSDESLSNFSFTEEGEEPKEKSNIKTSFNSNQESTKFSILSSMVDPKSQYSPDARKTPTKKPIEERYSPIYSAGVDTSSKKAYQIKPEKKSPHSERNNLTTRVTANTLENETELNTEANEFHYEKKNFCNFEFNSDGPNILPTKAYCNSCRKMVMTAVKIEMAEVPLWKRICCSNCYEGNSLNNLQAIVHYCKKCKTLIRKIQPGKL